MLRHAIAPSRRYTKASHDVVRHPRLCSDAKILILYVQGLPEGESGLALSEHARKLGIRGRAFQRLKEQLLVHGYVHERRASGDRGQWATHQLFSNVPLDDAGARELWRREAEGLESGGGGCSIGGAPGGVRDDVPGGARPVSPRGSSRRSSAPSARFPTVGRPGPRAVGHQLPVDEEREKNSSRPPSEAVAVLVGTSDTADGPGAREAASASGAEETRDAVESAVAADAADAAETPEAVEFAEAERVLLSLRHSHRELHLGVPEARALVGQAVEWLRRGVSGADLRRVLTSDLPPGGVRSAVGFLRHRLVQKMPAPVAPAPAAAFAPAPVAAFAPAPVAPAPAPASGTASVPRRESGTAPAPPLPDAAPRYVPPLVTCEGPGTEHVFRSLGGETRCPDCEQEAAWARWAECRIAALGGDALPGPGDPRPDGWRARLAAATEAAAARQAERETGETEREAGDRADGCGAGAA
ncbi:hypothetical protein [Streptomyces californicus]|uniref:hypothetical protein n=1 Tax=Streptomyces californicus TaxID=67351 RepID=UPI001E37D06A|nr:hypothetical protein [Streptomyces californicus]MCC0578711.1 hypothetical protein [Streptomyces californicus]